MYISVLFYKYVKEYIIFIFIIYIYYFYIIYLLIYIYSFYYYLPNNKKNLCLSKIGFAFLMQDIITFFGAFASSQ